MPQRDPHIEDLIQNPAACTHWDSQRKVTWCGNCGNYGIHSAIKRALALEELGVKDVSFCFDVGCNGNGSDKIEGYTIHGLHGRAISLAAGVKIANPKLKVIAMAGDGATFSEGVNHLVHGVRNDFPIVFILHNNENYGLTTGQASALTPQGAVMNSSPFGNPYETINPLDFVMSLKPSFVARAYSGEVNLLTDVLREALNHKGFAFIDVLQACPTYNKETPDEWYATRVRDVQDLDGYDNTDIWQARKLVQNEEEKFYCGVLYRDPKREDFFAVQPNRQEVSSTPVEEVQHFDVSELCQRLVP